MAITSGLCDSFKQELLQGIHAFGTDTIKIALYNASATLDHTATAYTATNECSGAGYTATGQVITASVSLQSGTGTVDFSTPVWSNATITTIGFMIYNSSKSNRAIAVGSFGATETVSGVTFQVNFPASGASTSIIRIA